MLNNAFVSTCFYVSRILFPSWKSEREVGSWGAKCPLTAYFLFMRQRKQCNLKTGVVSRRHRWESPPHTPCLLWMRHAWLSQRSQAVTGASVSHRSMAGSPHLCSPAQLLWQNIPATWAPRPQKLRASSGNGLSSARGGFCSCPPSSFTTRCRNQVVCLPASFLVSGARVFLTRHLKVFFARVI